MCWMVAVAGWLLAADRALRLHFANDTVKMLRANALTPTALTDSERAAVEWAVSAAEDRQHPADDTLRGLLERLK